MVPHYHEELAASIVKDVLMAGDSHEYQTTSDKLRFVRRASVNAVGRSRMENDLKKWGHYSQDEINGIMKLFSEKVGKNVNFRTLALRDCLIKQFVKELQFLKDPWETAKIISSLEILFLRDSKKKISKVVSEIKDPKQKRLATICARVNEETPYNLLHIFGIEEEI